MAQTAHAFTPPAVDKPLLGPALAAHIIRFDATDPSTFSAYSLPLSATMGSTSRRPIPWPEGKAPVPAPLARTPVPNAKLPACDYVIVTWTVEEARCLADTLTPGYASQTDWYPYTHNFASKFVPLIRDGAPALESKRLASWFPTKIAGKPVLCMKSELHLSQDGPKMPIALLWQQIIAETGCKLIITTGTAGGIGAKVELGDVVVAESVRFDCMSAFKSEPFHASSYPCSKLVKTSLSGIAPLFAANADHLPAAPRPPMVIAAVKSGQSPPIVVTTDFFAFDDSANTFHLQGLGAEMDCGAQCLGSADRLRGADRGGSGQQGGADLRTVWLLDDNS
jgi:nucleoside phosphorylase